MKKYYEYDAPVLTKLVSVVAIVAICVSMFSSAFCCYKIATLSSGVIVANGTTNGTTDTSGGSSNTTGDTTGDVADDATPADSGAADADASADTGADAGSTGGSTADSSKSSSGTSSSSSGSSTASSGVKGLSTPAQILAKYTEVMNAAKKAKPAFKKIEYQALPEEYHNLGSLGNTILPIAEGFMTKEDKAEVQDTEKGSDMHRWPLVGTNSVGCLLTDASAIKSAKAVSNSDGTVTLTIVLNSEKNPQPVTTENPTSAPSKTGAMFAPLAKSDIDDALAGIKAITVNSFDLTYNDCTTTITYNPSNNQVKSLTQVMNVDITANLKALIVTIDGSARLVNTMKIYDVVY